MSAPLPPGHTRRPAASAQTGKQDEHRCAAVALGSHGWICGVCKQPMPTEPAPSAGQDERCTTCNGRVWSVQRAEWVATRETVGMVCQTCGTDYGPPAPSAGLDTERLRDEIEETLRQHNMWWAGDRPGVVDALLYGPLRQLIAERDRTYRCCPHCKDDAIHDVPENGHDLPCNLCQRDETIARLIAERDRVREIHTSDGAETPFCMECGHTYPCLTIRALDGET